MSKKLLAFALLLLSTGPAWATDEYDTCYQAAQDDNELALCMKAETSRFLKEIQTIYLNVSKNSRIKTWNNGNGLIQGNLKDMYNSWLAYRNRYCSLYVVASENMPGGTSYDRERCLLSMTNEHLELMKTIILNANSGGEESNEDNQRVTPAPN